MNNAINLNISTNYYPFGSLMPGRHTSSAGYRYGFNGMEKDDEVKGVTGSSYDFGGRSIYDGRLARFVSIDPRWRDFPGMSPYAYAANNPIYYIDEDGEGPFPTATHLFNVFDVFVNALKNNKRDEGYNTFLTSVYSGNVSGSSSNVENTDINGFKYKDTDFDRTFGTNEYKGEIIVKLTNDKIVKAEVWFKNHKSNSQNTITSVEYIGKTSAPATGKRGYYIGFRSGNGRLLGTLRFDISDSESYGTFIEFLEKYKLEGEYEAAESADNDLDSDFYKNWVKENREDPETLPEIEVLYDKKNNTKRTKIKDEEE